MPSAKVAENRIWTFVHNLLDSPTRVNSLQMRFNRILSSLRALQPERPNKRMTGFDRSTDQNRLKTISIPYQNHINTGSILPDFWHSHRCSEPRFTDHFELSTELNTQVLIARKKFHAAHRNALRATSIATTTSEIHASSFVKTQRSNPRINRNITIMTTQQPRSAQGIEIKALNETSRIECVKSQTL
jgi:hypothetical protein